MDHFGFQVLIWLGFYFSYQAVRSLADREPAKAFVNGFRVIDLEERITPHLIEQTAQRVADSSGWLLTAAAWTYWNSEFTVIGLTLLWVYLRRHEHFARFRNTILLANMIGLIGYLVRADGAAVDVPELRLRRRREPLARPDRRRLRTRTPRCRASMPPTR